MKQISFVLVSEADGSLLAGQAGNTAVRIGNNGGKYVQALNPVMEIQASYYAIEFEDSELTNEGIAIIEISCPGALTRQYVWTPDSKEMPELTGEVYCTRIDVERRWGKINVEIMADVDNDNNPDKIAQIIDRCLNQVYIRMNSDFSMSIYKIPFDVSKCLIVRRYATDLAGIELYKIRQLAMQNEVELFKRAEEDYKQWLAQVYNGQDIPGAAKDFVQY